MDLTLSSVRIKHVPDSLLQCTGAVIRRIPTCMLLLLAGSSFQKHQLKETVTNIIVSASNAAGSLSMQLPIHLAALYAARKRWLKGNSNKRLFTKILSWLNPHIYRYQEAMFSSSWSTLEAKKGNSKTIYIVTFKAWGIWFEVHIDCFRLLVYSSPAAKSD